MGDLVIARLIFPNDPTNNLVAHQMFVGSLHGNILQLYSVSSILGKEKRVYGSEAYKNVRITFPEHSQNGFKVPSFIDCSKMYEIALSANTDLSRLSSRNISSALRDRIERKIDELKNNGEHLTFQIEESDFIEWNPVMKT